MVDMCVTPATSRGTDHGGDPRAQRPPTTTREALLAAALATFTDHGYGNASVAEIVERSGASVGSLYHHFGGKSGLYLTLWEDFHASQEARAARAVAQAREEVGGDAMSLFVRGARAYLYGCWDQRHVARLLLANDGPQGFDLIRRQRSREWVRQNTKLLGMGERRAEYVLVLALTTVIGEAGREVATCEYESEAVEIIDEVARLIARLSEDAE